MITMQPTTALRMFQPTRKMMRPVPVSLGSGKASPVAGMNGS